MEFEHDFDNLLADEDLDSFEEFLGPLETFDEVPLYSRYSQLDFLAPLTRPEANAWLVRAAVTYLERLAAHVAGRADDFFCMVSITGWDDYRDGDFLTPSIWYTRAGNGVLDHLSLTPATGDEARFVTEAVAGTDGAQVLTSASSAAGRFPLPRLYVTVPAMPLPA
ncbi:Imm15 family immunity protein [Kitasatospora sp. NPDC059646]|uniref:Imm15 family immunity protein n=1 Tax=Kitasatospora sp. NPDC059646 TaxID=3346893 RepID=UPI0036A62C07